MINALETKFNEHLKKYGIDALVNDVDTVKVFLKEFEDKTSVKDHKYLFAPVNIIKQGDYIKINDIYYIVIHEDEAVNNVYSKLTIRRIKHHINFVISDTLHTIPVLVDEIGQMTLNEQEITTIEGKIALTLQENEITNQIQVNDRFIKMNSAWKVISIISTEKNIIKIYAEKDNFVDGDDKENEIPAGYTGGGGNPGGTGYEITIQGSDMILLYSTSTYTAKVYADGVEVQENVTWTLSNTNASIVSQDSQSITIKGEVEQTNVTLTATLVLDDSVTATKEITIGGLF